MDGSVPVAGICGFGEIRRRLAQSGLRPTRQRLALGRLLFGQGDRHITAEMLFQEATAAREAVSLATVYNTLRQFSEAGLLRQLAFDCGKTFFDTNPSEHCHFFLEEEGTLIDMPVLSAEVAKFETPPNGTKITGIDVIVRLRRNSI